jgi:flagellar biosynthesis protein FlhF
MRIKSYFANSVQEAMEQARAELGAEAMLMNSKKTDPELRHLGAYEVVFGLAGGADGPARTSDKQVVGAAARIPQDALLDEIAELKRQIESVQRSVSRQRAHMRLRGLESWPELERAYEQLLASDFSEELAQDLVQTAAERMREEQGRGQRVPIAGGGVEAVVAAEIERRLLISPGIEERQPGFKAALFAGPPGCGKTSLLVKVAIAGGIQQGLPVHIVSADTVRVGASEQLAAYARIMGAGFQALHTFSSLGQVLAERRQNALVLIDTAGCGAADGEEIRELAGFLRREPQVEVHLVMPASLRQAVVARTFERFEILRPAKLDFTHFDEADRPGAVLDTALRSCIPVSFVSRGQSIPEDLADASRRLLLANLWESAEAAAASAA